MSDHIFTGSGVALITPIQSDGKVNYKVLEQLLEFHIAKGTDAIMFSPLFPRRSTEEFPSSRAQEATIPPLRSCSPEKRRKQARTLAFA